MLLTANGIMWGKLFLDLGLLTFLGPLFLIVYVLKSFFRVLDKLAGKHNHRRYR